MFYTVLVGTRTAICYFMAEQYTLKFVLFVSLIRVYEKMVYKALLVHATYAKYNAYKLAP